MAGRGRKHVDPQECPSERGSPLTPNRLTPSRRDPQDRKAAKTDDEELEPLDEESLERVMHDCPL